MPSPSQIRPPALLPGDVVGIVAPASNIDPQALEAGCTALRALGYVPYYLDSIVERDIYFAGSVARRVTELEHMFASPQVRAVVCARGGYGANHLLPHLDVQKLLKHPKPFVGYSDITTLLTWFTDHGLVTFHGPMVTKDFAHTDGVDLTVWQSILGSALSSEETLAPPSIEPLIPGTAEGNLYGGCLSMLVASLGTAYEVQTEGTILFLEDINAKPYQVDRMLMQLKLAGKFKGVRGLLFGEMLDCTQASGQDYTLQDLILRLVSDLRIPVAYGYASGHVRRNNRVLPFGVSATLTIANEVTLHCEAAVAERAEARASKESAL